jgi:hypothetical protein
MQLLEMLLQLLVPLGLIASLVPLPIPSAFGTLVQGISAGLFLLGDWGLHGPPGGSSNPADYATFATVLFAPCGGRLSSPKTRVRT